MKLFSWNVNGIRSVIQKGEFQNFIKKYQPDILCLQETKAKQGQAEIDLPQYEEFWNDAKKPGYSGTAIFSKIKPLSLRTDFGGLVTADNLIDQFGDITQEGRLLTIEFDEFFLINTYSPHTKRELERLPLKQKWDSKLLEYINELQKTKPVVICGDFNIAHQAIDLANPKQNEFNAGFTKEERQDFDKFMNGGLVDSFRHLYPDKTGAYTWWTWRANARARNVGWRIDYFLVSLQLVEKMKNSAVHQEQMGSDHCPVSLELD